MYATRRRRRENQVQEIPDDTPLPTNNNNNNSHLPSNDIEILQDVSVNSKELFLLILKLLRSANLDESVQVLSQELLKNNLLPRHYDWKGNAKPLDIQDMCDIEYNYLQPNHIVQLLQRLIQLSYKQYPPPATFIHTLIGQGPFSLLSPKVNQVPKVSEAEKLVLASVQPRSCSTVHMIRTMELGKKPSTSIHPQPSVYQAYEQVKVVQGHKNPVYCLVYDKTGHRFITGSDDKLVKIWWADTAQLIRSLRGHSRDITDLSVNDDNTLLASADNGTASNYSTDPSDNFIRVWSLVTYTPVAVFSEHAEAITAIRFVTNSNFNGLISTDFQGAVKFWNVSDFSKEFVRPIAEFDSNTVLCSDVSRGGTHFISSGDSVIRIWTVDPPQCVGNLFGHTGPVRSLRWSHNSDRFLSGSDDSSVRVWSHHRGLWDAEVISLGDQTLSSSMVLWSLDDTYAISAVSAVSRNAHADEKVSIRIWDSRTGKPVHTLVHHEKTIYVLENHPQDKKIILSASYDGMSILWDIESGVALKEFRNQPNIKMCDGKFSPTGQSFAISDHTGQFSLFCFGVSRSQEDKYNSAPQQQFFCTDYNPLQIDMNGYAIDANAQVAPHMLHDFTLCDVHMKVYNEQPSVNYDLDFNQFYGWKNFYDNERLVRLAFEALERSTMNFQSTQPLGRNANPDQIEPVVIPVLEESEEEEEQEEEGSEPDESGQSEEEPNQYSDESGEEDFFEGYASDDVERDDGRAIRRSKRHQRNEDELRGHYFKWNLRRKRSEEDSESEEEDISMESEIPLDGTEVKRPKKRRKKIPEYFAEWLQRTDPNTNAYLPQIGDNVQYFKQGHKMYTEKYPHASENEDMPWDIYGNLSHSEECNVLEIVYHIDNPTYCTIKLQLIHFEDKQVIYKFPEQHTNNNNNNQNEDVILDIEGADNTVIPKRLLDRAEDYKRGIFFVNFHGDCDIGDYLVLSSRIQHSIPLILWKPGDEFKSLFDDGKYYTGKILENNGLSDQISPWECLRVIWDESGEEGNMSPWEIETIEKHADKQPQECIDPDITEILMTGLNQIYTLDICVYFRDPVSLSQYPDYIKYVSYPMDLATLQFRVENKYYRRLESFLYDSRLVLKNAQSYNMEGSQVVNLARKIDMLLGALCKKAEQAQKAKLQPPSEDNTNISNIINTSENISNNISNIDIIKPEGITIEHTATPMETEIDVTNISQPYIPESLSLSEPVPPPRPSAPSSEFDEMIKEALEEEKHYPLALASQEDSTASQMPTYISRKKQKKKSSSSSSGGLKKTSKEKPQEHMDPDEFFKQFSEESEGESTQLQPTTSRQRSLRRQKRQELQELHEFEQLANQLEPVLPTGMHLRTRSRHLPQQSNLDFPEELDNDVMPSRLRSQSKRITDKTTTTQPRKIVFNQPATAKKNLVIKFKQQGNQWDLQKAEDKAKQEEDNDNVEDNNNNNLADPTVRVTRSGLKLRVRTGSTTKAESPPKHVDTSFEEKEELEDFLEDEEELPKKSKKKKQPKKKQNGKQKEEEEPDENDDWEDVEEADAVGSDASQHSDFSEDEDDQIIEEESDSKRRSTRNSSRNAPPPTRRSSRILHKEFGLEDDELIDAPEPPRKLTRRSASLRQTEAPPKKTDSKLTIKIPKNVSHEPDDELDDYLEEEEERPKKRSTRNRKTRSHDFVVDDDDDFDEDDE